MRCYRRLQKTSCGIIDWVDLWKDFWGLQANTKLYKLKMKKNEEIQYMDDFEITPEQLNKRSTKNLFKKVRRKGNG